MVQAAINLPYWHPDLDQLIQQGAALPADHPAVQQIVQNGVPGWPSFYHNLNSYAWGSRPRYHPNGFMQPYQRFGAIPSTR